MSRRFCVGDIHGHSKALQELLNKVEFDFENDLLISIGDLCDRGPDSWGVVELLMKVKNLVCIQGNHDLWFKSFLSDKKSNQFWIQQGGRETYNSYVNNNWGNIDNHISFYSNQIPYYILDNKCFVHGGFDRDFKISEQDENSLCWDRTFVEQSMSCKSGKLKTKDNFDIVFIGHTPTIYWSTNEKKTPSGIIYGNREPIMTPIYSGGVYNIDTGCGKGGKLSIVDIDSLEYVQTEKIHSF